MSHSRRTRFIFRTTLPNEAVTRVSFVTVPAAMYSNDDWWKTPQGFRAIVVETAKLIAYYFLYGNLLFYALVMLAIVAPTTAWVLRRRRRPGRARDVRTRCDSPV